MLSCFSFLLHCLAFLLCLFGRFAGDFFQHYLKELTNTYYYCFINQLTECDKSACHELNYAKLRMTSIAVRLELLYNVAQNALNSNIT